LISFETSAKFTANRRAQFAVGRLSHSKTEKIMTNVRAQGRLPIMALFLFAWFNLPIQAQQVHQLVYNNSNWSDYNLGGTSGNEFGGIVAFVTIPNNQEHIYYNGSDGHIHQRYFANIGGFPIWVDEDLTTETGSAGSSNLSPLAGFAVQNWQYVFYYGNDTHIHQLLYNNVRWTDQDLTSLAGGPFLTSGGAMVAFTTTPNSQIHVYYEPHDGDIHQLFFNGQRWSDEDLTQETGGQPTVGLTVAGFSNGNYQYIFYLGLDGHVHELYYNNIRWNDVDLTTRSGSPVPDVSSGLAALLIPGTQTMEVYYSSRGVGGGVGDIIQLASSDNYSWSKANLTYLTNGPGTSGQPGLTAFTTTPGNGIHVYYTAQLSRTDNHIDQLFFNGSAWSNEDLTTEANGGLAQWGNSISGFAVGNWQYVVYEAQ
jgi:hypothetical protein